MADRVAIGKSRRGRAPVARGLACSTIVQLELAKWLAREVGEDKADQVIAFTQTCIVAPLDTKIALASAEMCGRHKLATADAIVYATALEHDADLLTCDAHFEGLQGVTFIPKTSA